MTSGRPAKGLLLSASIMAAIGIVGTGVWWQWPQGVSPTAAVQAPAAPVPKAPPRPLLPVPPVGDCQSWCCPSLTCRNDPDQEYFVDGITDDLTTDLSQISDSLVIARNTAFTYKGKAIDAKQVAHDLGVRYVLEGSVGGWVIKFRPMCS